MNASKERLLKLALLWQVQMQSQFVVMAARELERALRGAAEIRGNTAIFYAIHNLLNAAGNVSKALWGLKGKDGRHYERRKPLRDALALEDSSPLYPLLGVRNGFEHYDNQLTQWIDETDNPMFVDCNVGDESKMTSFPVTPLRHFNHKNGVVRFLHREFHVPSVVKEIQRLAPLVAAELARLEREDS